MAFLYDQRTRLLRESWTADNLAQELYAMISADVASNTHGPVTVTSENANIAPITICNVQSVSPIFNITNPGEPPIEISIVDNQFLINGQPMSGGGGGGGGGSIIPVWG